MACMEEGINYIGSEISKRYVEYSNKRIELVRMQTKLF